MREHRPHLDNQRIEPSLIITLLSAPWELLMIFFNQNILRKLRHREISCLATQLGSIPPKEVPVTVFSSFFSQDTFMFQFVMDFRCFFPFFLFALEGVRQKL